MQIIEGELYTHIKSGRVYRLIREVNGKDSGEWEPFVLYTRANKQAYRPKPFTQPLREFLRKFKPYGVGDTEIIGVPHD